MTPAEHQAALLTLAEECVVDPLKFVMAAFDWGHGELADETGPDEWQREFLTMVGRKCRDGTETIRIAVSSGHGVGKTTTVAWLILWAMTCRPHLAGVVTANTAQQLESKTWRELALWHKRCVFAPWFEWTATRFRHVKHGQTWGATAQPWTRERSEAFAGTHAEHVLVVYDEASAIDDQIWQVTEGATTTPGAMWFAFGNPTRNDGRFAECWGRMRHRWTTYQVDSRKAKKADQRQIAQWIADYGEDSDFVRVRVRGVFPRASSQQFIARDLVDAARARKAEGQRHEPIIMGVDVARFGDDQTVFLMRQGQEVVAKVAFRNLDTMQTAARVVEYRGEWKPDAIFIDGVGVGAGVVDRLRQLGYDVIDVNAGATARDDQRFLNLRAEMWSNMREWLKAGGCLMPDDEEMATDLTVPLYHFDARNRLALERKDDMKARGFASPDSGDALALTFAQPVAPRMPDGFFADHREPSGAGAFDPTRW